MGASRGAGSRLAQAPRQVIDPDPTHDLFDVAIGQPFARHHRVEPVGLAPQVERPAGVVLERREDRKIEGREGAQHQDHSQGRETLLQGQPRQEGALGLRSDQAALRATAPTFNNQVRRDGRSSPVGSLS